MHVSESRSDMNRIQTNKGRRWAPLLPSPTSECGVLASSLGQKPLNLQREQGDMEMQERYCQCGARIMVQFFQRNTVWQPVYWTGKQRDLNRLHVCPSCGKLLDINVLS